MSKNAVPNRSHGLSKCGCIPVHPHRSEFDDGNSDRWRSPTPDGQGRRRINARCEWGSRYGVPCAVTNGAGIVQPSQTPTARASTYSRTATLLSRTACRRATVSRMCAEPRRARSRRFFRSVTSGWRSEELTSWNSFRGTNSKTIALRSLPWTSGPRLGCDPMHTNWPTYSTKDFWVYRTDVCPCRQMNHHGWPCCRP